MIFSICSSEAESSCFLYSNHVYQDHPRYGWKATIWEDGFFQLPIHHNGVAILTSGSATLQPLSRPPQVIIQNIVGRPELDGSHGWVLDYSHEMLDSS